MITLTFSWLVAMVTEHKTGEARRNIWNGTYGEKPVFTPEKNPPRKKKLIFSFSASGLW